MGLHLEPHIHQLLLLESLVDATMSRTSPLPGASLALCLAEFPGLQRRESKWILELLRDGIGIKVIERCGRSELRVDEALQVRAVEGAGRSQACSVGVRGLDVSVVVRALGSLLPERVDIKLVVRGEIVVMRKIGVWVLP